MISYFVDTSGWYDLVSSGSPLHQQVEAVFRRPEHVFVTTTHVLAELTALLLTRSGRNSAAKAGIWLRAAPEVRVVHPDLGSEQAAWHLFLERPDKTYTLTDCVSFVIMRALKLDVAIATDDHFRQEGFQTLP